MRTLIAAVVLAIFAVGFSNRSFAQANQERPFSEAELSPAYPKQIGGAPVSSGQGHRNVYYSGGKLASGGEVRLTVTDDSVFNRPRTKAFIDQVAADKRPDYQFAALPNGAWAISKNVGEVGRIADTQVSGRF